MTHPVPKWLAKEYGGAHEFRSLKRHQLRDLVKALDELRMGCAYFPCHEFPIDKIAEQVAILKDALSVKKWGE
jgi:hypothetical protein